MMYDVSVGHRFKLHVGAGKTGIRDQSLNLKV